MHVAAAEPGVPDSPLGRAEHVVLGQAAPFATCIVHEEVHHGHESRQLGSLDRLKERITSAICETDLTCLVLSNTKVLELYYQKPEFGLYLGQLIIQRLLQQIGEPVEPVAL